MNSVLIGNAFHAFGLLQKMMIEVSLQHQIVTIDLLKLLQKVFLADDELDHFLGD